MTRPRLLDLYCKAGGASMGFHMSGFEVVGIDIEPQPNYPFKFYQGDVLNLKASWIRRHFDIVAASPPCQFHTTLRAVNQHVTYRDLISQTRELLIQTGLPYVIENVEGARGSLINPITLCGSSFGLRVRRHRLFESDVELDPNPCNHDWQDRHRPYPRRVSKTRGEVHWSGVINIHGTTQLHSSYRTGNSELLIASVAMGIDWMTKAELNQAIPPAYAQYIGKQLMEVV